MSEKICWLLLILCGILCQGIFATLSDEDNRDSSDLVVRKRRVISHFPEDRNSVKIHLVNYVVNIKEYSRLKCAGVILTHHTVLTAAPCVRHDKSSYTVFSGQSHGQLTNPRTVTLIKTYYGNPPREALDGIALINVNPPFEFTERTGKIDLYTGILPAGTMVTVSGWGTSYPIQPGPKVRNALRSITLPIMNHEECRNIYRRHFITDKHICTYHEQKYTAYNDAGAPLVVNGRLAGIHVWKGETRGQKNPDIFINLQRSEYSEWIRENVALP